MKNINIHALEELPDSLRANDIIIFDVWRDPEYSDRACFRAYTEKLRTYATALDASKDAFLHLCQALRQGQVMILVAIKESVWFIISSHADVPWRINEMIELIRSPSSVSALQEHLSLLRDSDAPGFVKIAAEGWHYKPLPSPDLPALVRKKVEKRERRNRKRAQQAIAVRGYR
jgi:hypothetical protein